MATPNGAYMGASDAFTWYMERDPTLRSTVVVIIWLDRAPKWDLLVARIDRLSRLMPAARQRVVEPPFRLATPRWTHDPGFDLYRHLRRMAAPRPRTRDAILELARRSAVEPFDRDRPLWKLTLVGGMAGGEAALVLKFHHSLSDGVGGMASLAILADLQREPSDLGEMPPVPTGRALDSLALVADAVGATVSGYARLAWRGAEQVIPALLRWTLDPVGQARGAAAMAGSVYRTAWPDASTMSPLMRERSTERRLAMIEVALDDLKMAAKTIGVTVNDAYLAAVTGGLRRYHEHHGVAVGSLRAVMPISIRTDQDTDWGNRITLLRLAVPAAEPDPATRMRLLHGGAKAAREEPSLSVTGAIAGTLNLLPVGYVGGILKHADFVASNVPGTSIPVYVAGSKVTGLFTFGPTIGTALNTTMMSYAGHCGIGINIDTAAVPDPDLMVACLREGFAEVTALAGCGRITA
jgi:diacylglycerol O-acyltransferase / wax synthase